ncbi:tRNA 2-selenouridine(34) synthase MnmH [Pseudooceanicola sp. C21-150M6]|uniref:tRNA 2-selenouridine(34) synthase MnmH n=1 Tax=Pseudooceanicola sp. C21-150M6 TaxID=3434355 RepID=UPI003D7FDD6C
MPYALTTLAALETLPFDEVIDVRSPAEFAEDHIPGSISLPALDNAERARVGTIYTQQDPFLARKIGAALVARNAARHLEGPLADRPGGWQPLVYCWRGGQRSGSFTSILQQIGWRADTVQGGYKSYRRLVVQRLHDQPLALNAILIDGYTGTAKTEILHHLSRQGAQVIDLEGLAQHRGSLFGGLAGPQPAQKMFESRLAAELRRIDPAAPVFLEAESNKIGDLMIPPTLWKAMLAAPRIRLRAPAAARARHLIDTYEELTSHPDQLLDLIDKLRPYHAADRITLWQDQARQGDFAALARSLMEDHYDPRYEKSSARTANDMATLQIDGFSPDDLAMTATRISELIATHSR